MTSLAWAELGVALGVNGIGLLYSMILSTWKIPAALRAGAERRSKGLWERLPLIFFNCFWMYGSAILALNFLPQVFSTEWKGWLMWGLQMGFILLVDDTGFYWLHRFLHENRLAYARIHKLHHRAYAPLPLDYMYTHPAEVFLGAIAPSLALLLLGAWMGQINGWVVVGYHLFRNSRELLLHSGVRSLMRGVPFLPVEHHELHHGKPGLGNYGSTFGFWDNFQKTAAPQNGVR